jgi:cell division protein FtsB
MIENLFNRLNNSFNFRNLLLLSAIFISGIAGYFSIYGIGNLFSGAIISVITMAVALEIGKLISVSFCFRYWNKLRRFLKLYFSFAIIILMIITSAGIYGYLSNAYNKSHAKYEVFQYELQTLNKNKERTEKTIKSYEVRINTIEENIRKLQTQSESIFTIDFEGKTARGISDIQENQKEMQKTVNEQIKNYQDSIKQLQTQIGEENTTIKQLQDKEHDLMVNNKNHDIETFKFIAEALNVELNVLVKWFIFTLIIVFDPLAVSLLIAYNILAENKENKQEEPTKVEDTPIQEETPPEPPKNQEIEAIEEKEQTETPLQEASPEIKEPESFFSGNIKNNKIRNMISNIKL